MKKNFNYALVVLLSTTIISQAAIDWDLIYNDIKSSISEKTTNSPKQIEAKNKLQQVIQSAKAYSKKFQDKLYAAGKSIGDAAKQTATKGACLIDSPQLTKADKAACALVCKLGRTLGWIPSKDLQKYIAEICACECIKDDPKAFEVLSKALYY